MKWMPVAKPTHPLENASWVHCVAVIRNNQTGEVRRLETHEIMYDDAAIPSVFNWAENNFSCDCNREIFFAEAAGDKSRKNLRCSKGRYSVNLENPAAGEVYYREFS